jgi:hypothetical protein
MASIALSIIGCIDYLAYGTIFMGAMFRPKKKLDVFFPNKIYTQKAFFSLSRRAHSPPPLFGSTFFGVKCPLGHVVC